MYKQSWTDVSYWEVVVNILVVQRELIEELLESHKDTNLNSAAARKKLARDIIRIVYSRKAKDGTS